MTTPEPQSLEAVKGFLAHMGIELPDEISEQSLTDANDILAHFGVDTLEVVAIGPDGKPLEGEYVEQHGVKGMRWGVRKRVVSAGRSGPSPSKPKEAATKPAAKKPSGKRSAKSMTDQELNAVINRLRLESQYSQLTASKSDQAKQFIKDTLLNAGKATVQNYANQYLNAAVGAALNKAKIPSAASITQAAQKAAEEARKAAKAAT